MNKTLVETVTELVEPLILEGGMELVDIEFLREPQGWVLRLYIDHEGGITLDQCSKVSHLIGDLLDAKDLIPHRYTLEVSSPGLNRPLKKEKDFIIHTGKTIKVKTKQPINSRRNFQGTLLGYHEGNVTLRVDNHDFHLPLSHIMKATVVYQFPKVSKHVRHTARGIKHDI